MQNPDSSSVSAGPRAIIEARSPWPESRSAAAVEPSSLRLAPAARAAAVPNGWAYEPAIRRELVDAAVARACASVPPLWTLRNFVAVNPHLGLTGQPFARAVTEIDRIKHGEPLLRAQAYRDLYAQGRIGEEDLEEALAEAPSALLRPELAAYDAGVLRAALFAPGASQARVLTFSEWLDREDGAEWSRTIVDEIARWCAARFDAGQSSWPQPGMERPIYEAWRELARLDRSPEVRGLSGFRGFVSKLPSDAGACIDQLVRDLQVPASGVEDLLARELASVSGWAGHVQYRARQAALAGKAIEDRLEDLLAIRLAFDAALYRMASARRNLREWARGAAWSSVRAPGVLTDLEIRHVWQLAFEAGHRRRLGQLLAAPREQRVAAPRDKRAEPADAPRLQAVFCIDVRSERLRRHLEASAERVETIGFAGFFGLATLAARAGDDVGESRCPALIAPQLRVKARDDDDPAELRARSQRERFHAVFKQLRLSSVAAFPFVETVGQLFGLRLVADSLGFTRPGPDSRLFFEPKTGRFDPVLVFDADAAAAALEQKVGAAEAMLRNMGLTTGLAPFVLLCGHGSSTTNNPYGSALDCGACGGYAGDVNARAAVALLNDAAVREALVERGLEVPRATRFLAGLHDTTTDAITLYDTEGVPDAVLREIRSWLDRAGRATRRERAPSLGLEDRDDVDRRIAARSRDWSELRPEWGLAGNAAFIAAPRARTRGLDLEGRCFLHDYHADRDPDGSVLELILTAPLVVASWINLQYYASTVDNATFGSGTKTIHNVVGRHGVLSGNGGDLRVGLPLQSVHDGERFMHEPLRLTAFVEAPTDRIVKVLEEHDDLRELVEHQWIHLMAIDGDGPRVLRWTPEGFRAIDG